MRRVSRAHPIHASKRAHRGHMPRSASQYDTAASSNKTKLKPAVGLRKKIVQASTSAPSSRIIEVSRKNHKSSMGRHVSVPTTRVMNQTRNQVTSINDRSSTPADTRIGAGVQEALYRENRNMHTAVRSVSKTGVHTVWRHRSTIRQGTNRIATGMRSAGTKTIHTVKQASHATVAAVHNMIHTLTATVGMQIIIVLSIVMVIALIVTALTGWLTNVTPSRVSNVPVIYQDDVQRAGSICQEVTVPLIAAQIEQESNWNPKASSPAGAQGIAQFMPDTWAHVGKDGDGDGKADVLNAHDAIFTQGHYMCSMVSTVTTYVKEGKVHGDIIDLALASYNAGAGAVLKAGGIPNYSETKSYIMRIKSLMVKYQSDVPEGSSVGQLTPPLVMSPDGWHVNVPSTGTDENAAPTYQRFQCTWWAAIRRAQIGKPVDPFMGNGQQWAAKALSHGWTVSNKPAPGDVICFQGGVHGSDITYGHVAVVEQVNADGSIIISQSGTGWMAVVTETITSTQLTSLGNGVSFIK